VAHLADLGARWRDELDTYAAATGSVDLRRTVAVLQRTERLGASSGRTASRPTTIERSLFLLQRRSDYADDRTQDRADAWTRSAIATHTPGAAAKGTRGWKWYGCRSAVFGWQDVASLYVSRSVSLGIEGPPPHSNADDRGNAKLLGIP
jgi:hypothetical protein